jgi:tetratricopeptide (TPR) repeat protein
MLFFLFFCAISFSGVVSKLCFARGYFNYLSNRETEAIQYLFKAYNIDSSFKEPIRALITIFNEDKVNQSLLDKICESIEATGDDNLYASIGSIFEDEKLYEESLRYFKKARSNKQGKYTIDIARNLIAIGDYIEAKRELTFLRRGELQLEDQEDFIYYSSLVDFHIGNYIEAGQKIDSLIAVENPKPNYFIHKARILLKLEDKRNALLMLSYALSLKKELPEAYFEIAKIHYSNKNKNKAIEALERTLYYDNCNSLAYMMMQLIYVNNWIPLEVIKYRNNNKNIINIEKDKFVLTKGNILTTNVIINKIKKESHYKIGVIEPYGFGLESELINENMTNEDNRENKVRIQLTVKAMRSNKTNLNRPWLLNLIFADIKNATFCNKKIIVSINDKQDIEGRILYVVTEDHEQTGDSPHVDNTPNIPDLDLNEINVDLIQKGIIADKIAQKYGVKWTHMIDIGSSFLRLKWIQEGGYGEGWNKLWDNMRSYLRKSLLMGNDIQLHIHAYSIPDNKLFRQYFNKQGNKILFKDNQVLTENLNGTHGAWAENYTNLGDFNNMNSRIGSVYRGIKLLEKELHQTDSSYRTSFFRAGEYEFGTGKTEIRKSILALNKNDVLSGSDAHTGNPFKRDFKFYKKIGRNAYFSKPEDINESASSLLEVGILQMLPVPKTNAQDYLMPIDDWKHIKYNYDQCFSGKKIRNDIFVLMEMYHLNSVNSAYQWDRLDSHYEDWGRMDEHFKYIKDNCLKIEPVTISEAIKAYLNRYSPDIVPIRTNEYKVRNNLFTYNIEFVGEDISVDSKRPHFVKIKPPSYFLNQIKKIEIVYHDAVIKSWYEITDYRDLDFKIINKDGYKMLVYLKM